MATTVNDEERTLIRRLYDAAVRGCVVTLNTLLQKDQFIIHKISLTSFTETPLHISALLGHLDFTKALLSEYAPMAEVFDSLGRYPLHLASAEGHTEVVKALLRANSDVCMSPDQDDRTPLHLAAMRGRVEVIKELVSAKRDSTSVLLDGDSVFHLCVKYNHIGALVLLVNLVNDGHELVKGNNDGNTILHLAVLLNQAKTVRYVLSIPGVKNSINILNGMNFTALDFLDLCTRDVKSLEIRDSLMEAGARRAQDLNTISVSHPRPTSTAVVSTESPPPPPPRTKTLFAKCRDFFYYQGNTIDDIRGPLMVVATVIASMSFQATINPPDAAKKDGGVTNSPGEDFYRFLVCNTLAFTSSVAVLLLIISGIPLKNKFGMWLLTLVMCSSIMCAVSTYGWALTIIFPDLKKSNLLLITVSIWYGIVFFVGSVFLIRCVLWMVKIRGICLSWLRKCFPSRILSSPGEVNHATHI